MTEVEKRFIENEIHLSKKFSFERLGRQLNVIASCPDSFRIHPPATMQKNAKALYTHLIKFGYKNPHIENSLVHIQSRNLINDFLKFIGSQR